LSELQTDKTRFSDFARALNSMMDNLENAVVIFERTLSAMLEKIERLETLEKSSRDNRTPNENELNTKENKQLTNDATTAEMPHQEASEIFSKTRMTTNTGTDLQQPEIEIQGSAPTMEEEGSMSKSILKGNISKIIKKVSSKSNYFVLAVALAVLGVIIVKLYLMLFP